MDATGVVKRPLSRLARFSRRQTRNGAFQEQGPGYIGLDFAQAECRAVQLQRRADGLYLRAALRLAYPRPLPELQQQPAVFRLRE